MTIPEGWQSYDFRRPPHSILCKFARLVETPQNSFPQEQGKWVGFVSDLSPQCNVAGLYWTLTGIGRMQLDSMGPEERQEIEDNSWWFNDLLSSTGLTGNLDEQYPYWRKRWMSLQETRLG